MARARIFEPENEAPPEADRLGRWPHPREVTELFGHAAAEAAFADALASGRLHHGWMLAGEAGIGKATLAYRLTRLLLTQPSAEAGADDAAEADPERIARQVGHLSHPGLFLVRRAWDPGGKKFRQTISIDDIRAMRHFLQRTAVTPWRVVIVDSADDLNLNSANALLKSLEEPPARTVFFILSTSPGRLLPTIRSRCRVLRLNALGDADLTGAVSAICRLAGHEPPGAAQLQALAFWGKGSPRRVLQLMEGGGLAIAESLTALMASLPALDRIALHKFVAAIGPRESEASALAFDLIEELLAEAMGGAARGSGGPRLPQLAALGRLMTPDSLADWSQLWETLRQERAEAERLNLDKAALMLMVFDKIEAAARAAAKGASGRRRTTSG
jgi:DNA polymerase-3 subunit delta'